MHENIVYASAYPLSHVNSNERSSSKIPICFFLEKKYFTI